jgi:hypothetical protein
MGSNAKKKTTMAKLNRENKLRERRLRKDERKEARKHAAVEAAAQSGAASADALPEPPAEGAR